MHRKSKFRFLGTGRKKAKFWIFRRNKEDEKKLKSLLFERNKADEQNIPRRIF